MEEINEVNIKIKELEFIQNIIHRMSDRQHNTKYICWIILGAIFGFNIQCNSIVLSVLFCTISIIFIRAFYKLDYNFLKTEKLYRKWYDFILKKRNETNAHLFVLNLETIKEILAQEDKYILSDLELSTQNSWAIRIYTTTAICLLAVYFAQYSLPAAIKYVTSVWIYF